LFFFSSCPLGNWAVGCKKPAGRDKHRTGVVESESAVFRDAPGKQEIIIGAGTLFEVQVTAVAERVLGLCLTEQRKKQKQVASMYPRRDSEEGEMGDGRWSATSRTG
jgi:hypothetical protein